MSVSELLDFPLHLLLLKDDSGSFTACCLEFDLIVDGADLEEVANGMSHLIAGYLQECERQGQAPMRPAPPELWNRWLDAHDEQHLIRWPTPRVIPLIRRKVSFSVFEAVAA